MGALASRRRWALNLMRIGVRQLHRTFSLHTKCSFHLTAQEMNVSDQHLPATYAAKSRFLLMQKSAGDSTVTTDTRTPAGHTGYHSEQGELEMINLLAPCCTRGPRAGPSKENWGHLPSDGIKLGAKGEAPPCRALAKAHATSMTSS